MLENSGGSKYAWGQSGRACLAASGKPSWNHVALWPTFCRPNRASSIRLRQYNAFLAALLCSFRTPTYTGKHAHKLAYTVKLCYRKLCRWTAFFICAALNENWPDTCQMLVPIIMKWLTIITNKTTIGSICVYFVCYQIDNKYDIQ